MNITPQPTSQPRARRTATPRMLVAGAAMVLLAGLGACGSDDNSSSTSATTSTAAVSSTEATSSTAAASTSTSPTSVASSTAASQPAHTGAPTGSDAAAPIANAVTVTAPGMAYQVSGPLRPGVATITFTNTDATAHMMAVARLKPDVTLDQVVQALRVSEDAAGALLADGPETAYGTPAPVGAGQSTTVTALDLPAGDYVLICFFTDADGTPHYQMGMINLLTVDGEPATEKPNSDGTITIDDAGTTLPDGFTGHGTYLVTNTGAASHSISFARLDSGTTLDAYFHHVGVAMNGAGVIDGGGGILAGGVDDLAPGASAYLTLDLAPGHYGFVSTADANGPELPAQSGELDIA